MKTLTLKENGDGEIWLHVNAPSGLKCAMHLAPSPLSRICLRALREVATPTGHGARLQRLQDAHDDLEWLYGATNFAPINSNISKALDDLTRLISEERSRVPVKQ